MKDKLKNKILAGLAVVVLCFNFGFVFAEESVVATEPSVPTTTQPENNRGTKGNVGPLGDPGNIAPTGNKEAPTTTRPIQQEEKIIDNNDQEGIVTGVNDTSQNSGNGTIDSGEANISAGSLNTVGSNITGSLASGTVGTGTIQGDIYLDGLAQQGLIGTSNSLTGANSQNGAEADILNQLFIDGNNTVFLTNNVPLNINTGDNTANYNTGNADIQSGNVNLSLNLINLLSSFLEGDVDLAVLDVYGDYTGDIIVPESNNSALGGINNVLGKVFVIDNSNRVTGANSQNQAETEIANELAINVDNDYSIANNVPITVDTGGNEAGYNTGDSTVTSGNINIGGSEAGILNVIFDGESWYLVLVNVLGDWMGSLAEGLTNSAEDQTPLQIQEKVAAENESTGANSENEAAIEIQNELETNLSNNVGITNNYDVNVNTGNNQANYNTGNANIASGNVNILANFVNFLGSKIKAQNIYVFIANIFGNWTGGVKYGDKKIVDVKPSSESVKTQNSQTKETSYQLVQTRSGNTGAIGTVNFESGTINAQDQLDIVVPGKKLVNATVKSNSAAAADIDLELEETGSPMLRDIARGGMIFSLVLMAAAMRYQRKKIYKK